MTLDTTEVGQPELRDTATPPYLLTARDLAKILNVHENYVYDLASRGLIPSYKIGGNRRFRWSEVEQWLDNQRAGSYDGDEARRV